MEPSARFERAAFSLPRRRSIRWSYEGVSWVPRVRTWKRRRVKACRVCQFPHHPSRAACRSRTRCLGGTSSALSPDELTRHGYARRESDPHQLGSRPSPSTCLRHERLEPLDGLEPPAFPVRKGRSGQVSYRGMSWGTRARTWTLLLQGQACCLVTPFPIKIREDRAPPGIRTPDLPIKSRTL